MREQTPVAKPPGRGAAAANAVNAWTRQTSWIVTAVSLARNSRCAATVQFWLFLWASGFFLRPPARL
jgi:hypothetical protein